MPWFAKRLIEPELMDHADPEEARLNLGDLIRINRKFGGHSVMRKLLASAINGSEKFTMLDVGAASGETARLVQQLYPRATVVNLDYNAVNSQRALQPKVLANAFALPFQPDSFDYIASSLFLHHFTDQQVVSLLQNFRCIARHAVLITDLERSIVPYCFLPATRYLLGWREITVSDGQKSVRAAFLPRELAALAREAGFGKVEVHVHRPAFRLSLMASK